MLGKTHKGWRAIGADADDGRRRIVMRRRSRFSLPRILFSNYALQLIITRRSSPIHLTSEFSHTKYNGCGGECNSRSVPGAVTALRRRIYEVLLLHSRLDSGAEEVNEDDTGEEYKIGG